MKVEIKTNQQGYCDYFKIDGKKYGAGIQKLNIIIEAGKRPEIIISAKPDEFIADFEDSKLYLEKRKEE